MAEPNDLHTGGETEHSNEEITEGVAMDVVAQPSNGGKTQQDRNRLKKKQRQSKIMDLMANRCKLRSHSRVAAKVATEAVRRTAHSRLNRQTQEKEKSLASSKKRITKRRMGAAVKRLYKHKLNLVENLDELADHAVVKVRTKRSYMSKQTAIGSNSELTEADNNLGMKQPNSKRIISNVNRKNDKSDSVVFATGKKQHHKGKQVSAASDVGGCDLRTVKNSLERSTKEEIKEKRPYKKRSYFSPFEPRQLRKRQKFNYKETQPYSSSFRLTCSEISAKNLPCEKAMDAAKSGPPVKASIIESSDVMTTTHTVTVGNLTDMHMAIRPRRNTSVTSVIDTNLANSLKVRTSNVNLKESDANLMPQKRSHRLLRTIACQTQHTHNPKDNSFCGFCKGSEAAILKQSQKVPATGQTLKVPSARGLEVKSSTAQTAVIATSAPWHVKMSNQQPQPVRKLIPLLPAPLKLGNPGSTSLIRFYVTPQPPPPRGQLGLHRPVSPKTNMVPVQVPSGAVQLTTTNSVSTSGMLPSGEKGSVVPAPAVTLLGPFSETQLRPMLGKSQVVSGTPHQATAPSGTPTPGYLTLLSPTPTAGKVATRPQGVHSGVVLQTFPGVPSDPLPGTSQMMVVNGTSGCKVSSAIAQAVVPAAKGQVIGHDTPLCGTIGVNSEKYITVKSNKAVVCADATLGKGQDGATDLHVDLDQTGHTPGAGAGTKVVDTGLSIVNKGPFTAELSTSPKSNLASLVKGKWSIAEILEEIVNEEMSLSDWLKAAHDDKFETVEGNKSDTNLCHQCHRVFPDVQSLTNHSLLHSMGGLHECPLCGDLFANINLLADHVRLHRVIGSTSKEGQVMFPGNTRPFCCVVCRIKFVYLGDLACHRYNHVQQRQPGRPQIHLCLHCNKHFSREVQLVVHRVLNHEDAVMRNCFYCGLELRDSDELVKHIQRLHLETKSQQVHPQAGLKHSEKSSNTLVPPRTPPKRSQDESALTQIRAAEYMSKIQGTAVDGSPNRMAVFSGGNSVPSVTNTHSSSVSVASEVPTSLIVGGTSPATQGFLVTSDTHTAQTVVSNIRLAPVAATDHTHLVRDKTAVSTESHSVTSTPAPVAVTTKVNAGSTAGTVIPTMPTSLATADSHAGTNIQVVSLAAPLNQETGFSDDRGSFVTPRSLMSTDSVRTPAATIVSKSGNATAFGNAVKAFDNDSSQSSKSLESTESSVVHVPSSIQSSVAVAASKEALSTIDSGQLMEHHGLNYERWGTRFKCFYCGLKHRDPEELVEHIQRVHVETKSQQDHPTQLIHKSQTVSPLGLNNNEKSSNTLVPPRTPPKRSQDENALTQIRAAEDMSKIQGTAVDGSPNRMAVFSGNSVPFVTNTHSSSVSVTSEVPTSSTVDGTSPATQGFLVTSDTHTAQTAVSNIHLAPVTATVGAGSTDDHTHLVRYKTAVSTEIHTVTSTPSAPVAVTTKVNAGSMTGTVRPVTLASLATADNLASTNIQLVPVDVPLNQETGLSDDRLLPSKSLESTESSVVHVPSSAQSSVAVAASEKALPAVDSVTEDNPGQMTPYTQEKNNCDTDQQQVLPVSNLLTSSSSESRVVALSTGNTAEKANRFMNQIQEACVENVSEVGNASNTPCEISEIDAGNRNESCHSGLTSPARAEDSQDRLSTRGYVESYPQAVASRDMDVDIHPNSEVLDATMDKEEKEGNENELLSTEQVPACCVLGTNQPSDESCAPLKIVYRCSGCNVKFETADEFAMHCNNCPGPVLQNNNLSHPQYLHTCSDCGLAFRHRTAFLNHYHSHHESPRELAQSDSLRDLQQSQSLCTFPPNESLREIPQNETFKCSKCQLTFAGNKSEFAFHESKCQKMKETHFPSKRRKQNKTYECSKCQLVFAVATDLVLHSRKCEGRKAETDAFAQCGSYKCPHCKLTFAGCSGDLATHISKCKEKPLKNMPATLNALDKGYRCHSCKLAFHTAAELATHVSQFQDNESNSHSNNRKFECSSCQLTFNTAAALASHISDYQTSMRQKAVKGAKLSDPAKALSKDLQRPFSEAATKESTNVAITNKDANNSPENSMGGSKNLGASCTASVQGGNANDSRIATASNIAGSRDTTSFSLTNAAVAKALHECKGCRLTFQSAEALTEHLNSKHMCDICDTLFTFTSGLLRHFDVKHNGTNCSAATTTGKLICKVCDKRFHTPHGLLDHFKQHQDFRCPGCKCGFPRECDLITHILECTSFSRKVKTQVHDKNLSV